MSKSAELKHSGNSLLMTGVGVAAIGAAGAALGAVCPLCVVAAPALAGFGIVQRFRAARQKSAESAAAAAVRAELAR